MAELPSTTPLEDAPEPLQQPALQFPEQYSSRTARLARTAGRIAITGTTALFGAFAALQIAPYETTVAGIHTEVRVTTQPGISLDTTLGNWEYPHVTSIPLGLNIRPKVDLDTIEAAASDTPTFTTELQHDIKSKIPSAAAHFALMSLIGVGAGGLIGFYTTEGIAARMERRGQRKSARNEAEHSYTKHPALVWMGGALGGIVAIGAIGGATYNPHWQDHHEVTGTLADMLHAPKSLSGLSRVDTTKGTSKIVSLIELQKLAASANEINEAKTETAFNVLLISDMHLRNFYPSLQPVIDYYNVGLIIDTGDETEMGTQYDLNSYPEYLASLKAITAKTPMVWVKGNHDTPAVTDQMAAIPGVTVLDHSELNAYGLTIGGFADPISYTDGVDINDPSARQQEVDAGKAAADSMTPHSNFDILLSHEPPAVEAATDTLDSNQVRMTIAGHTHKQALNTDSETIHIVEGSTGRGGLFEIDRNEPEEFSVLSIAPDCQFTELTRYQIGGSVSDSHVQLIPLPKQTLATDRTCSTEQGITSPVHW